MLIWISANSFLIGKLSDYAGIKQINRTIHRRDTAKELLIGKHFIHSVAGKSPFFRWEVRANGNDPHAASLTSTKVRPAVTWYEQKPYFTPNTNCSANPCIEEASKMGAKATRSNRNKDAPSHR